ncbi:hypothetical protein AKJ65_00510 [candidate division MSBL1 archaeon SCGC-AAA259E19]|uniref:Histone deacetylase domain-containing protein n=1 Tax=candidate division MSBL1 archaeon SCGC-AAA259E19 TaxID=1698264 RepID=A0A133UNL7_9EURY|nr:hypothetical protein AKJ65_00510 [candidate division MSBL1 archaeon SCGC-AAA259E19]
MKTGIVYSDKYLKHFLGRNHPEKPERLEQIIKDLRGSKSLLKKIQIVEPSPADQEEIELAHDKSYVEKIKKLSKSGQMLDLDTPINSDTFDLALLAAGGTASMGRSIVEGEKKNGFALIRPPGHHATRTSGGGFCYFNNIAITTRKLLKDYGLSKILIFDYDAHHGNGTQDIFYSEEKVLYLSLHQDGRTLYPGTGFPDELGEGDGEGYTVNVPFPPSSNDGNYIAALREFLIPLSKQFNPDFIMVSLGFDSHREDPLTNLEISTDGFEVLAESVIAQAKRFCDGKIGFVLEGGYAVEASADSALRTIGALTTQSPPDLPEGKPLPVFEKVKDLLSPYWEL